MIDGGSMIHILLASHSLQSFSDAFSTMFLAKIYLIDDRSNAQLIESDLFGTLEVHFNLLFLDAFD